MKINSLHLILALTLLTIAHSFFGKFKISDAVIFVPMFGPIILLFVSNKFIGENKVWFIFTAITLGLNVVSILYWYNSGNDIGSGIPYVLLTYVELVILTIILIAITLKKYALKKNT